ncbi:FAD/NAD(P)-binding domain-containing protein [Aspergillus nidulans var. acristatus]
MPLNIIIVGGSLSALMHAIPLHRAGHKVHILEQTPTATLPSHLAGICLGPDMLSFLDCFDLAKDIPLGSLSTQIQSLDADGTKRPFLKGDRIMTSWDALYFRLRMNFDGVGKDYVASRGMVATPGQSGEVARQRAVYETGKRVVDIKDNIHDGDGDGEGGGRISLVVQDILSPDRDRTYPLSADMVLGADGPSSTVRSIFLGDTVQRKYTGYVVWRGVVPESLVSKETRRIFEANVTQSSLGAQGGHVIVYNIPNSTGSITPGTRLLNIAWYTNISPSSLPTLLTDKNGMKHHTSIPPNLLKPALWSAQLAHARTVLPPPYLEILTQIKSPFMHTITDYVSSHASFLSGRVLLVGDALALLRPHVALSTNTAAFEALLTEKLVRGDISVSEWEERVIERVESEWAWSVWVGEWLLRPRGLWGVLVCGAWYWGRWGVRWVRGLFGLRTI